MNFIAYRNKNVKMNKAIFCVYNLIERMEPLNLDSVTVGGMYDVAITRIIDKFDYHYHSILSLQKLIILVDSLSKAECNPREYYVNALKTVINSYGTENKRLNDFKANEVIIILKSSLNIINVNTDRTTASTTSSSSTNMSADTLNTLEDTFDMLVKEFICEFSKYTTALSLRKMTDRLSELPIELKQKHSNHYNSITGVIMSYGKENKPLTLHQSKKLMRTLRREDDVTIAKPHSGVNFMSDRNFYQSYMVDGIIPHVVDNPRITKLSQDDVLYEIIRSLQQGLMGNIGSGMSTYIFNFFDSCELILENEVKYNIIMKDIKTHFESCGWKMKDTTTLGGFQTAPDATKIINGLVRVIDTYF
jgi:hypothetical protein